MNEKMFCPRCRNMKHPKNGKMVCIYCQRKMNNVEVTKNRKKIMERARELRAEGLSYREIERIMGEEGFTVSRTTLGKWFREEAEAEENDSEVCVDQ